MRSSVPSGDIKPFQLYGMKATTAESLQGGWQLTCDMRLRCEGGGQEEGCMAASSGIMPLLLVSCCPLLELACSLLACPFIFTCPLSCVPPFASPATPEPKLSHQQT